MVEELGAGGELFDRIIDLGSFSGTSCHILRGFAAYIFAYIFASLAMLDLRRVDR